MEFAVKKKSGSQFPSELPAITEAGRKMIFNRSEFLEIYERTASIKREARRRWGKMNVVQMLNHLKIATGSGLKLYKLKDESSILSRGIIKFLVLRVLKQLPKNAAAPKGFKSEMNRALDFNTEKEEVLNILKKAHSATNETYPHPLFGIMTREEWGILIYRHFDHHLRQFGS